jgi:hypothetical protein
LPLRLSTRRMKISTRGWGEQDNKREEE